MWMRGCRHIHELFKHLQTDADVNLHSVVDADTPHWSRKLHVCNECQLQVAIFTGIVPSAYLHFTGNVYSDVEANQKFLPCSTRAPHQKYVRMCGRRCLSTNSCGHGCKICGRLPASARCWLAGIISACFMGLNWTITARSLEKHRTVTEWGLLF